MHAFTGEDGEVKPVKARVFLDLVCLLYCEDLLCKSSRGLYIAPGRFCSTIPSPIGPELLCSVGLAVANASHLGWCLFILCTVYIRRFYSNLRLLLCVSAIPCVRLKPCKIVGALVVDADSCGRFTNGN